MACVRVHQLHHLTVSEARLRIDEAVGRAQERYRLICRWADGVLEVFPPPGIATGVWGRLVLEEGSAEAEVELPGPYRLVRTRIAHRISAELSQLLDT